MIRNEQIRNHLVFYLEHGEAYRSYSYKHPLSYQHILGIYVKSAAKYNRD